MSSVEIMNYWKRGLKERSLQISVVGLGYVGLPTAISFHDAGFPVTGFDISLEVVDSILSGNSEISDEIGKLVPSGDRWTVTTNIDDCISEADIAIICVPTPIDKDMNPDLNPVKDALNSIIASRKKNSNLILILESTVQPGTTNKCVEESLSSTNSSREGLFMAYCPERISPGEVGFGVGEVSRVIGSESLEISQFLSEFYGTITTGEIIPVSSIEVAEASKLVENAQRDIDIAFANELAILLPKMNLDVEEVLDAASTKWNFHRHTPGMGVGGHCIPIDPHYYIEIAKRFGVSSSLSPSARELNSSMPEHNANEVFRLCGGVPEKVLVLGYAYKPNISDTRETPLEPFINFLYQSGVEEVLIWDPLIEGDSIPHSSILLDSIDEVKMVDCIVIGTAHDQVVKLDWNSLKEKVTKPRIYDSRRCLDPERMEEDGWTFHAIGRPFMEVRD